MGWEPPDPPQLLITSARVAKELGIPQWKANELCWCLERVFYTESGIHFRVTRRSFEAFKDLLDQGLSFQVARSVMARYRGELPPPDLSPDDARHIHWRATRRHW